MVPREAVQTRVRTAFLVWAAWTGIALLFALQSMLPSTALRSPAEWGRAITWQLAGWWSWAILTPAVLFVARAALALRPPAKTLGVHLAAGVTAASLGAALAALARWTAFGFRPAHDLLQAVSRTIASEWVLHLLIYGAVVGVFYAVRAGRLEAQLARSRVDALAARLKPHFLYNALNTISSLVLEDPRAANRMITRLSELLRQAFDRTEEREVALDEEITLVEHYVAIQEMRFGDRVRVRITVHPDANSARVPPLILQPLVENAIAHGIDSRANDRGPTPPAPVAIEVEVRREDRALVLLVRDNGPGFRAVDSRRDGVGLASTRARLAELYGSSYKLVLSNAPVGGAEVRIEIPFHSDASADR